MKNNKSNQIVLEQILENIPHYIFWKDKNLNYLGANKKFAIAAGFENIESLVGKSDYDACWTKEEADFFRSIDRQVMESNQPILNVEESQQQLDGSISTLLTNKVPLHNSQGGVIGILGIYIDITAEKNLKSEKNIIIKNLQEVQEQLIHSEKIRSVGEMVGGIAHEINNPLAIIMGNTSVLMKQIKTGNINEDVFTQRLERINNVVLRLSKITSAMRNLAGNNTHDELSLINLNCVIDDTLSLCEYSLTNLEIPLKVEVPPELRYTKVLCNRVSLSQVLLNLINNARDAISSQKERWIKLSVEQDRELVIKITDSGAGIPDEIAQNIFNSFYTTKERGKGTGMGLSLSRKLAERQGATIQYCKENNKTCFIVTFPKSSIERDDIAV